MRSPQAWGWTVVSIFLIACFAAFPTGVGMDRATAGTPSTGPGVPHRRGDGPRVTIEIMQPKKRSPQAWGWTD